MRVRSVHVALLKHVELYVESGNKLPDLLSSSGFLNQQILNVSWQTTISKIYLYLRPKLVWGESKDGKSTSFRSIFLMEFNQLVIIYLNIAQSTYELQLLYTSFPPELKTFEWWISGLRLNPLFFLISRLNIAWKTNDFNLQSWELLEGVYRD